MWSSRRRSLSRLSIYAAISPSGGKTTVVEAMLCSIGLLIIAKQIPNLIGRKFEAHEFWEIVGEVPHQIMQMDRGNAVILLVGGMCLALTVILSTARNRFAKIIPPPLTVVLVGLVLGRLFGIGGRNLIEIVLSPKSTYRRRAGRCAMCALHKGSV